MLYNDAAIQDYHDLFNSAENEVSILTGKYDTEYADEFIIAASDFSSRQGTTLRIACQCGKSMLKCHIIKSIINNPERKGDVFLYDAHEFKNEPYFILADESAYRLEIPEAAETIIDYDDKVELNRLNGQFHQVLSISTMLKYPQLSQAS